MSDLQDVGRERFNNVAFKLLAKYIGVFSAPQNTKRVPISEGEQKAEPVAMTAPVQMGKACQAPEPEAEAVAMTTPVQMGREPGAGERSEDAGGSGGFKGVMTFFLPKKYKSVDQAPAPTDNRVRFYIFLSAMQAQTEPALYIQVKLRMVPERVEAVTKFTWYISVFVLFSSQV